MGCMKWILLLLVVAVPCARALSWKTNKLERGTSWVCSLAEKEWLRGIASPLRHAEQRWEMVWPSGPESNVVRALRLGLTDMICVDWAQSSTNSIATADDDIREWMGQQTDAFDADFRDFVKDEPTSSLRYDTYVKAGPSFISPGVICLTADVALYTGGAHGMAYVAHSVHDAATGRALPLGEIIPPSRQKILCGLLEQQFRRDAGMGPTNRLGEHLFEDQMTITSNYTCTADGLLFTYGQYEIACYAAGIIEITLPWATVRDLLVTGTPVRAEAEARARGK